MLIYNISMDKFDVAVQYIFDLKQDYVLMIKDR